MAPLCLYSMLKDVLLQDVLLSFKIVFHSCEYRHSAPQLLGFIPLAVEPGSSPARHPPFALDKGPASAPAQSPCGGRDRLTAHALPALGTVPASARARGTRPPRPSRAITDVRYSTLGVLGWCGGPPVILTVRSLEVSGIRT